MIGGQQAMFGKFASYAQQISPMGQAMGMAPSYAQPYGPMQASFHSSDVHSRLPAAKHESMAW